jgi:hypothetical protein
MYFADDVLLPLGYHVDSMDASDYEGANIVHDLNLPIPPALRERYDLVWDGATLEHVFNFPVAIFNAMHMVKVGGHLLLETPTNNQCGHGFYQFSPELFFRLLTPQNGFELLRVYLRMNNRFYHVADPIKVHDRVELLSAYGAYLMVHSRKIGATPEQIVIPQQSDYPVQWDAPAKSEGRAKAFLRAHLSPGTITKISFWLNRRRIKGAGRAFRRNAKISNRAFFTPVRQWDARSTDAFPRSPINRHRAGFGFIAPLHLSLTGEVTSRARIPFLVYGFDTVIATENRCRHIRR